MAYYTEPTANDTLGIYEFFNYVNVVSGGLFFPVILMVIWVVTFIALKGYTTSRAWTGASFLVSILSVPLAIMKLIAPRYMYLSFMFLAGGILWMKIDK
jgi:hypothetical protein